MNKNRVYLSIIFLLIGISLVASDKIRIKAIAIPLADHYPAIIAYEKYAQEMKKAEFQLKFLKGPNLVRAYFYSQDDADIAFDVSPMVMDMYQQKPYFKWISLIHRDGNALAINDAFEKYILLDNDKRKRKPNAKLIDAINQIKSEQKKPVEIAVPSLLATHTTILYKYLKDYNQTMSMSSLDNPDVLLRIVKPPKSPAYLKNKMLRKEPAAFEQSMPWAEVAHSHGSGEIAWYSKDVMKTKNGHVECVIIAKNDVIEKKREALQEVIYYIHKAGIDIEKAREKGGVSLERIVKMIQKHIPSHSKEAILQSLRPDVMAINYRHLNIDENSKNSFKEIMNLAYEAGFIKKKIDIEALADDSFNTKITDE